MRVDAQDRGQGLLRIVKKRCDALSRLGIGRRRLMFQFWIDRGQVDDRVMPAEPVQAVGVVPVIDHEENAQVVHGGQCRRQQRSQRVVTRWEEPLFAW